MKKYQNGKHYITPEKKAANEFKDTFSAVAAGLIVGLLIVGIFFVVIVAAGG